MTLTVLESVCDDCPLTQDVLNLGPGIFDASLAAFLGISRFALGGYFNFDLEGLDGDATSAERSGRFNTPTLTVEAQAVPEPSISALGVITFAIAFLRRSGRRPLPR